MLLWLINLGFAGGGTVVPPEPDRTPPGVKKRPVIRLSDIESREELARFIKSHLNNPPEVEPKPVYKAGKPTQKQRDEQALAELAMRNMQIEQEEELRIEYNNSIMLLLLASINER